MQGADLSQQHSAYFGIVMVMNGLNVKASLDNTLLGPLKGKHGFGDRKNKVKDLSISATFTSSSSASHCSNTGVPRCQRVFTYWQGISNQFEYLVVF